MTKRPTADHDAPDPDDDLDLNDRGSPGLRRWLAYQDRKSARVIQPGECPDCGGPKADAFHQCPPDWTT
jgi:hypothetical protein